MDKIEIHHLPSFPFVKIDYLILKCKNIHRIMELRDFKLDQQSIHVQKDFGFGNKFFIVIKMLTKNYQ